MTSTSMRRLPMRPIEAQHPHDENAMPTYPCSAQAAASPSTSVRAGHARSPSKMPTLSDIAARLNREKETSTPGSSPMKLLAGSGNEAARPRLELTGRITGSPKPPQSGERKSPLLPTSPTKTLTSESQSDAQTLTCLSPKAPSSGACSPTKRMLAKGLPSLEEIRDRMSRKGLAALSDDTSPKLDATPSSPKKPAADRLSQSPELKQATEPVPAAQPLSLQAKKPFVPSGASSTVKPALKVTTSSTTAPRLTHPLPPTPTATAAKTLYPLQHEWTLYFDTRAAGPPTPSFAPDATSPHAPSVAASSWEANLRTIGSHSTVNTFLGCFSKLHRPSQLERHSSYHVFKDGIKPMWEDARNANGGKWTITFRQRNPALVDRSWLWLVLGLIGEELDAADEVCGAVCSVKPRGDRIALWVRERHDVESVNRIGRKLLALLELEKEPGVLFEFSSHSDRPDDGKLDGVFSLSNPVQAPVRSPTASTFGLPSSEGSKLSVATASAAGGGAGLPMRLATSPTSPNGKSVARSPLSTSPNPNPEPFARLGGQPTPSSTSAASPLFGALGQSLGLGIGANASPSVSPNPSERKNGRTPFQRDEGALSWRSNRSTSPQRPLLAGSNALPIKTGGGATDRSRSVSPFKMD